MLVKVNFVLLFLYLLLTIMPTFVVSAPVRDNGALRVLPLEDRLLLVNMTAVKGVQHGLPECARRCMDSIIIGASSYGCPHNQLNGSPNTACMCLNRRLVHDAKRCVINNCKANPETRASLNWYKSVCHGYTDIRTHDWRDHFKHPSKIHLAHRANSGHPNIDIEAAEHPFICTGGEECVAKSNPDLAGLEIEIGYGIDGERSGVAVVKPRRFVVWVVLVVLLAWWAYLEPVADLAWLALLTGLCSLDRYKIMHE
ncbi:hypothetical protein N0V88_007945 [Collariella sp. IMI 366227]|nr:hypothetical protein N0V88_007945 [Collariella sp. IMI 366227]